MSAKISDLPAATSLAGPESIPAVQGGANVKTCPLDLANFMAGVPDGMSSFRVLKFGSCCFDPGNNESISLTTASGNSAAIQFLIPNGGGGTGVGLFGGRLNSGVFIDGFNGSLPFSLESFAGFNFNSVRILDWMGNLLDNSGNILLNLSAGQQPAIADATGTDDVVDRLNDLLGALRNLGLIET